MCSISELYRITMYCSIPPGPDTYIYAVYEVLYITNTEEYDAKCHILYCVDAPAVS